MAQHDYNIEDQNGFDFLVDLNFVLRAIMTNSAGSYPNPTLAHMFWFDANNDQMKVRNEANSEWVIVAKKEGNGWIPYQPDNRYAYRSNNLSDLGSAATARANLGAAEDSSDPDFTNDPNAAARRGLVQQKLINLILDTIPELVAAELHASGSAPMYACRAWVNFNGTGTVAIRASGNVSSITDNGKGDYTVNFTTNMEDANYSVQVTADHGVTDRFLYQPARISKAVSYYHFRQVGGSNIIRDSDSFNVAIFR